MDVRGKSDRARAFKKLVATTSRATSTILIYNAGIMLVFYIPAGYELIVDLCILYAILE